MPDHVSTISPCCSHVSYIEKFDLITQTWTSLPSAPQTLVGMERMAVSIGDLVYVNPSAVAGSYTYTGDTFAYNTSANSWSTEVGTIPMQLTKSAMVHVP